MFTGGLIGFYLHFPASADQYAEEFSIENYQLEWKMLHAVWVKRVLELMWIFFFFGYFGGEANLQGIAGGFKLYMIFSVPFSFTRIKFNLRTVTLICSER